MSGGPFTGLCPGGPLSPGPCLSLPDSLSNTQVPAACGTILPSLMRVFAEAPERNSFASSRVYFWIPMPIGTADITSENSADVERGSDHVQRARRLPAFLTQSRTLGSSDGLTLLSSCFSSDLASEKFMSNRGKQRDPP